MASVTSNPSISGNDTSNHRRNQLGQCPCCQTEKKLGYTISGPGIATAICAYRPIYCQLIADDVGLEKNSKFKCFSTCQGCTKASKKAAEYASAHFRGEVDLLKKSAFKSAAQTLNSPLDCGSKFKTLLEMFKQISCGKVSLFIGNLSPDVQDLVPLFKIGDSVEVKNRTLKVGQNPRYGMGTIINRRLHLELGWQYGVEFVLGGKEYNILSEFINIYNIDTQPPKRGSCVDVTDDSRKHQKLLLAEARFANTQEASARAIQRAEAVNIKQKQNIHNLQSQVKKKEEMLSQERKEVEMLMSQIDKTKSEYAAQTASLQFNYNKLLEDFKKNCTQEKEDEVAEAIQKEAAERVQNLKKHGKVVRRLEEQLRLAQLEVEKVEANALDMVTRTRDEVTSEFESVLEQNTKDVLRKSELEKSELLEMLNAYQTAEASRGEAAFSSLVESCLPSELVEQFKKRQNLDQLGARAKTVADMGTKGRRILARLTLLVLNKVVETAKAGEEDVKGLVHELMSLPEFKSSPLKNLMVGVGSIDTDKSIGITEILAEAYKSAMRSKEKEQALSLLSIIAIQPGQTVHKVRKLCTDHPDEINVNDRVKVNSNCVDETEDFFFGTVCDVDDRQVYIKRDGSDDVVYEYSRGDSRLHCFKVKCSRRQVKNAILHAHKRYPGARVIKYTRKRGPRVDKDRTDFVVKFLGHTENVERGEGSFGAAKSGGAKDKLKMSRCALHRKLSDQMIEQGLKPVSWGYFYNLTKDYDVLTADNCCCGACRDLGMHNFRELQDIVSELFQLLKGVQTLTDEEKKSFEAQGKELFQRVQDQQLFLNTEFFSHLKNEDACGFHCLTHLLTTFNNSCFCKACSHDRGDDVVIPDQLSWEDYVRQRLGRAAKATDWNDECEICSDRSSSARLLCCQHCNVVAHKSCIEGSCNDLPKKDGSWSCPDCVRQTCDQKHHANCDQCCEFPRLAQDIERSIQYLAYMYRIEDGPSCSTVANEGAQPPAAAYDKHSKPLMLSCRLREVIRKQDLFRAHKIRHRNQHSFKDLCMNNMPTDKFYVLVDYWAKLKPQKDATKTCEGGEVGISVHGLVFLYRNLTIAERERVSIEHPEVDWSDFPPAVDEDGPFYLEQYLNEFCDNAKQTSYHTAAGLDAAFKYFLECRPWLSKGRNAFLQSDGAINYHEPTTEVDLAWILVRCFSEAGEGKDWIDANSAIVKCIMRQCRNRGFFQQNAYQYFVSAEQHVVNGNTNLVVMIDASSEEKVEINEMGKKRTSVPGVRNFALYMIDDREGTITFWESLDYLASEKSMAEGGPAVGYGPGLVMDMEEFNKVHRTRVNVYDSKIVHVGSPEKSTRAHKGKDEKAQEKRDREEKQNSQKEKRALKKATAAAWLTCADFGVEYQCVKCSAKFLSNKALQHHVNIAKCKDKEKIRRDVLKQKSPAYLLSAKAQEAKEAKEKNIKNLSLVQVKLKPVGDVKSVGIKLREEQGCYVIDSIIEGDLAFRSTRIDEDFILVKVDGEEPTSESCLEKDISDSGIDLVFRRPAEPIPVRGFARKGFKKSRKFKINQEQEEWLNKQLEIMGPRGSRAAEYHSTMKNTEEFAYRIREDTDTPFWLSELDIEEWLKKKNAEIKKRKHYDQVNENQKKKIKTSLAPLSAQKRPKAPLRRPTKMRRLDQDTQSDGSESTFDSDYSSSDDC